MIILKITGGLGNQFFQYAAAKSLAVKHNVSVGIDTTSIRGNYKEGNFRRKFKLDRFNVDFIEVPIEKVREYLYITKNRFVNDRILSRFRFFERNVWHDNGNIKEFNSQSGDVCLIGFFVSSMYFDGIKEILKKEFELKDKKNIINDLTEVKKTNSVSIHVRRGDLLKLKNSYILPISYYKKAIKIISSKIKNPKFYIFSDDIAWCKNNFSNLKNVVFVEGHDASEDFEIMKNCKHNILSNSTFAWWAGYLNPNKKPLIISPKHFNIFKGLSPKLQLKNWIII